MRSVLVTGVSTGIGKAIAEELLKNDFFERSGGGIGVTCVACEAGKYNEISHSSACLNCPSDSNSPTASDKATDCSCNVGYSGHERGGLAISYAAAALGITSLERHFTLNRTMYGSDQAASIETHSLKSQCFLY